MYDDRRFDDASISRMLAERCTMKLRFTRTSFFIHGRMSRLSPMAISTVLPTASMNTMQRNAESMMMSRWLEMQSDFAMFSLFSMLTVSPLESFWITPLTKGYTNAF